MAGAPAARRGLVGLLKQGWNEIPEVLGATAGGLVGIAISCVALKIYYSKNLDNRRFKLIPVVVRPEDPRAKQVRTD